MSAAQSREHGRPVPPRAQPYERPLAVAATGAPRRESHHDAAIAACLVMSVGVAPQAWADTDQDPASADAAAPIDDGRVPSGPPANLSTRDGWTLTLSSEDETQVPVAPLTTALSSRDYIVGGTFTASLSGPDEARGILEVGYDIGWHRHEHLQRRRRSARPWWALPSTPPTAYSIWRGTRLAASMGGTYATQGYVFPISIRDGERNPSESQRWRWTQTVRRTPRRTAVSDHAHVGGRELSGLFTRRWSDAQRRHCIGAQRSWSYSWAANYSVARMSTTRTATAPTTGSSPAPQHARRQSPMPPLWETPTRLAVEYA